MSDAARRAPDPATRERILEAAYACFARFGLGKTTVEDVVKESGVSRATIYRVFPGGKDQLLREVVAWEMGRFFGSLAEAVVGAPDFASLVEDGLLFAHRAVAEHIVLQKILVTEPERLLPLLTTEQQRPLEFITGYLMPFLEREEREGRMLPGLDQRGPGTSSPGCCCHSSAPTATTSRTRSHAVAWCASSSSSASSPPKPSPPIDVHSPVSGGVGGAGAPSTGTGKGGRDDARL